MTNADLRQSKLQTNEFYHDPVMLTECLDALRIRPDGTYGDCTLGGGGHSFGIANKLNENGTLHAFDRDEEAVAFATRRTPWTESFTIWESAVIRWTIPVVDSPLWGTTRWIFAWTAAKESLLRNG